MSGVQILFKAFYKQTHDLSQNYAIPSAQAQYFTCSDGFNYQIDEWFRHAYFDPSTTGVTYSATIPSGCLASTSSLTGFRVYPTLPGVIFDPYLLNEEYV